MKWISKALLFLFFATSFTYAVPSLRIGNGTGAFPYQVYIAIPILIIAIFQAMHNKWVVFVSPGLNIFYCTFALSILISSLFATRLDIATSAKYLLFAFMPILIALVSYTQKQAFSNLWFLTISGVIAFAIGCYGYFTGDLGTPIEHSLGYFGITYASSTRNTDMLYLQSVFFALLMYFIFSLQRKKPQMIIGALTLVIAMGMLLSYSRGTWVSIAATIGILIIYSIIKKRNIHNYLIIAGIIGLIPIALYVINSSATAKILDRFNTLFLISSDNGNSNENRLVIIENAITVANSYPLGTGVANLKYFSNLSLGAINHAENTYLQLLVEQGPLGLFAYLYLFFWLFQRVLLIIDARSIEPANRWVPWTFLGILINWAIYSVFNVIIDHLWFWLNISVIASFCNSTYLQKPITKTVNLRNSHDSQSNHTQV